MVDKDELIAAAKDAIGTGRPDEDWRVTPTEHAALLRSTAPSLADVLEGSRAQGQARRYEELNGKAIVARDTFRTNVVRANWAIFVTASVGALLLVTGNLSDSLGGLDRPLVVASGIAGLISGGVATMWLSLIQQGGLASGWAKARAQAEARRLAYFRDVMAETPKDPQSQLFALEYVRRYLLDNQIDYFRERGAKHERAARAALAALTVAVFVASTSTAVAGLIAAWFPGGRFTAIAGIGVVASAFGALVTSRSAVNRDRRNAEMYGLAQDQLEERRLDLDVYRARIADGGEALLEEFFKPVFAALASDHKAWLEDAEKRELAIGEMANRLDAAKEPIAAR